MSNIEIYVFFQFLLHPLQSLLTARPIDRYKTNHVRMFKHSFIHCGFGLIFKQLKKL